MPEPASAPDHSEPTESAPHSTESPPHRARIDWQRIGLEGLFVMLGVLLALLADEWRQGHVDRRRAERAMQEIQNELIANRRAVHQSLEYHVGISTELSKLADPAVPAPPKLFSRGFTRPASVLHTAWEAGNTTDAVRHLAYEDVLLLSRVYEQQQSYVRQSEQISQLIYTRLFEHGFQGMLANHANLANTVSAFWYRECQLLSLYDAALEQMKLQPAERPTVEACARALSGR